jgi:leucine-rich repeat-containing protein 49
LKNLDLLQTNKKEILKGTVIEGGHAEIEDDSILFIFGNAYEIVLSNLTFQESIEKI